MKKFTFILISSIYLTGCVSNHPAAYFSPNNEKEKPAIFDFHQYEIEERKKEEEAMRKKEEEAMRKKEEDKKISLIIKNPVNVKNIYSKLSKIQHHFEKSEFETQIEYNNRIKNIEETKSPFNLGEKYAFKIDHPSIEYNADTQKVKVTDIHFCEGSPGYGNDWAKDRSICNVTAMTSSESNYRGSNAFGSSTNILKRRENVFSLLFIKNHPVFRNKDIIDSTLYGNLVFEFELPIDIAKKINNDFNVYLIGEIESLRLSDSYITFRTPTIIDPFDIRIRNYGLPFNPEKIVVTDNKNRDIFSIINLYP